MKIMTVVGARPNFMKVAPIIAAIREHNSRASQCAGHGSGLGVGEVLQHVLVHTGQHYDQLMSGSFFTDLNLPPPDVHLGAGSGSHAGQTAEIMRKFEAVLIQEKPDVLVVVGDVNSTLACALVAAKISLDVSGRRPRIAHVEAGLRSFDRSMPEEVNRILTDQLSDWLFVTEESGVRNLAREGVAEEKVHFVGNTMIDSLLAYKETAEASTILDDLGLRHQAAGNRLGRPGRPYALLTLHRPANVDNRDAFSHILAGIDDLAREYVVMFPAHPRTQQRIRDFGLEQYFSRNITRHLGADAAAMNACGTIRMTDPLGYLDFLCLMSNAILVVTDSGGIQEETTCLGIPCVTVRTNTERPVTISAGTNVLGGVETQGIRAAIRQQLGTRFPGRIPDKWDGQSADRILEVLLRVRDPQQCSGQGAATGVPADEAQAIPV